MAKQKYLICKRVSCPGYTVPGSLPSGCAKCAELVWIAPSGFLLQQDNPGIKILCLECGLQQMATEPGEIGELTPAQLVEIEEWRRENEKEN